LILPANSTIGYDDLAYLTVKKVNGKEIKSLDDLAEVVNNQSKALSKSRPKKIPSRSSSTHRKSPPKPRRFRKTTAFLRCKDCSERRYSSLIKLASVA
jgi:PDZ domain